jgi:hypothetical protein
MKKQLIYIFFTSVILTIGGCSKDNSASEITLTQQLLSNKTWYLDYVQTIKATGTNTKTYIGQSTYYINFLKDQTTQDSDGLNGTYSVEKINGQLQIRVKAKTGNANSVEYIYNIEKVGTSNLILYYTISDQTIKQYYSNNK